MEEEREGRVFPAIKLALGVILLIFSFALSLGDTVKIVLRISAALICGYEIIFNAGKNLLKMEFFDENALMLIASVTAFIIGESFEGVLIIILYSLGEMLEDIATDNSREKIAGLAELKSLKVTLWENGKARETEPENVPIGSLILVKKGDRVPIDGVLASGDAEFDLKAVTGESKLYSLSAGEKIYGGAINTGDAVIVKTEKLYKDSTVEKIIEMVEKSTERKAKSQKFITTFAKIYTPCVVLAALSVAVIPPLFDNLDFVKWIYKALSFLIISCPCALVISVPLGFFIGIGSLAKRGILIKGSNYIDALSKTKIAVFDKTGTLTTGEFSVDIITVYNGCPADELVKIAASIEQGSSHPIAKALKNYANGEVYGVDNIKEYAGKGVVGEIGGAVYAVGGKGILKKENISLINDDSNHNVIYVEKDGILIGEIQLVDSVKKSGNGLVEKLRSVGITETVILSGDKKEIAEKVAKDLKIEKVYSELLPEQKTAKLAEILSRKGKGTVLYCGDGVNDSPSIAAADVGIAMGALGSEAAIECADVIIADDNLMKIPYAIKRSKLIKRKVITNIICSVAIKVAIMALSIFTPLPIWLAMFGDVGVMLLALVNSLSISLYK
ncbi:MAG: heavy metal translocating P-type ATPase [Christensenellaceae bacterium]